MLCIYNIFGFLLLSCALHCILTQVCINLFCIFAGLFPFNGCIWICGALVARVISKPCEKDCEVFSFYWFLLNPKRNTELQLSEKHWTIILHQLISFHSVSVYSGKHNTSGRVSNHVFFFPEHNPETNNISFIPCILLHSHDGNKTHRQQGKSTKSCLILVFVWVCSDGAKPQLYGRC